MERGLRAGAAEGSSSATSSRDGRRHPRCPVPRSRPGTALRRGAHRLPLAACGSRRGHPRRALVLKEALDFYRSQAGLTTLATPSAGARGRRERHPRRLAARRGLTFVGGHALGYRRRSGERARRGRRSALRRPHNWVQLAKFCTVGATGYVVNLAVFALLVHGSRSTTSSRRSARSSSPSRTTTCGTGSGRSATSADTSPTRVSASSWSRRSRSGPTSLPKRLSWLSVCPRSRPRRSRSCS